MEVVNPSMMVSRLDLGGSGLCGDWINISSTPLGFLEYLGIYRAKRRFGGTQGGHNPTGRACAPWHALVGAAPLEQPLRCFLGPVAFFWPKKILQELRCIWTLLILISCDVKNMQNTATGTWHYVNRLLPKNYIK